MSYAFPALVAGDAEFDTAAAAVLQRIRRHADDLHVAPDRLTHLDALSQQWTTSLSESDTARDRYRSSAAAKNEAGRRYRRALGAVLATIRIDDRISDELRRELALDGARDDSGATSGPPALRPAFRVEAVDRLRHRLTLRHPDGPAGRVWPDDSVAVEVRVKIGGDATSSPADYAPSRTLRRRTATFDYAPDRSGDNAHYLLRYLDRTDRPGPWSQVVTASIAAVV